MTALRVVVVVAVVGLGLFVALSPGVVYAPTPRVVLYLLVACLPAILFAAEATARFQMRLPGFVATAGGATAVLLIVLVLLTQLSKPEQQIAAFQLFDESGHPIAGLDRPGALRIPTGTSGLTVTKLVDGNTVVLVFPEQVAECELQVQPVSVGPVYAGMVQYGGTRQAKLTLGRELVRIGKVQ